MLAYEFNTVLKDNTIEVPADYVHKMSNVKVVLLYDDYVSIEEAKDVFNEIMKDYKPAYDELAK
jgi:hypothetical protein